MQTIYLVTGLPGVGKTSFLQVLEGLKLLPEYSVTPQKIARIYNSSETYAMQKLVSDGRSFLCELPLEQEKMEQFFGLLEGKAYTVNCYCIGLPDAAEAIARLVRRDRTGVPAAKIVEDFELFPSNIWELAKRVESIKFFDNTCGFCLTGYFSAGKFMLSDAGHCVLWMQTVRAALLPDEQQAEPKDVWKTKIFERKAKENKAASKTAYRSTSEAVSRVARAGAQQAAKTATVETVKATATVTAGAATAGTSVAVQAAAETAKKVTVGTVQKIQESAQTATAVHAHDMARAAQQHVANKTKDVPATDAKGLPKILMAIWIGMVVLLLVFSNSFGSLASSAGRAINLNDRVESYRASITYWAQKDGIPEYVEVLLALCMAETGILDDPKDPFACSESGLAVKQPNGITDPEYSIEIGVYCFSLKVKKTGCKSPADKNNLFKALQAYNMGDGFIDFCDTYYSGVWSVECARAYSKKMGGGSTYGNPNYIEQFLRCYTFGTISGTYPGSLNAHGLCAPLEPGWEQNITQHFGGMYSGSPHKGMDIGMPEGTPVYAAADGKVTVANASDSWGYSWGYYVKINHAEGVDTLYAHLSSVAVSYGQYVHQGDVIGYVGSTGNSSGNHLHFELYLENNRVDPYPYIGTDLLSKYLERVF